MVLMCFIQRAMIHSETGTRSEPAGMPAETVFLVRKSAEKCGY